MEKTARELELEKLIASGEYGVMTECAYGTIIADKEVNKKIVPNTDKDEK